VVIIATAVCLRYTPGQNFFLFKSLNIKELKKLLFSIENLNGAQEAPWVVDKLCASFGKNVCRWAQATLLLAFPDLCKTSRHPRLGATAPAGQIVPYSLTPTH
jgi:hypothetical protein